MCRRIVVLSLLFFGAVSLRAADESCRKVVTVYIDLSQTITGAAEGHAPPLYALTGMVRRLLNPDSGFVRTGDGVTVVAFGKSAKELIRITNVDDAGRVRLLADLEQLSGPGWPQSAVITRSIAHLDDFQKTTDLGKVFEHIGDQLQHEGTNERHIMLVASDFAHDPDDDQNREREHAADFNRAFTKFESRTAMAFVPPAGSVPLAQLMLLRVPPVPSRRSDVKMANVVLARWHKLKAYVKEDISEETAEALEAAVEERFSSAVQITDPRRSGADAVTFTLVNPNRCGSVTVKGIHLTAPGTKPLDLALLQEEVIRDRLGPLTLHGEGLVDFANREVEISAVPRGEHAKTTRFWFGDTFHIKEMTPRLYPHLLVNGHVMLVIKGRVSSEKKRTYQVTVLHPPAEGEWTRTIVVSPSPNGESNRVYIVPFDAPSSVVTGLLDTPLNIEVRPVDDGDAQPPQTKGSETGVLGPDGLMTGGLGALVSLSVLIVLGWCWYKGTVREAMQVAASIPVILQQIVALGSYFCVVIGIDGVSRFLRHLLVEPWILGISLLEAGAFGVVVGYLTRMVVLGILWPKVRRMKLDPKEMLKRRMRYDAWIPLLALVAFVAASLVFILALGPTGRLVTGRLG
jgi:hypothetical protein